MKKRFLAVALTLAVIAMLIPTVGLTAGAATSDQGTWGEYRESDGVYINADLSFTDGHAGTEEDPHEISTAAQLAGLAALVNESNDFSGIHIKLTADIDLSGFDWIPIGTESNNPFRGRFDGAGYTVSGLTIGTDSMPEDQYQNTGLFGYVETGEIKNLTVSGSVNVSYPSGEARVGGLVGYVFLSKVINCHSRVNVTVSQNTSGAPCYVGGVVGHGSPAMLSKDTLIIGCINSGSVNVTCNRSNTHGCYVGGVAGYIENMNTPFINCFNSGSITVTCNCSNTPGCYVGGVVGYAKNHCDGYSHLENMGIFNCANVGNVTGGKYTGGIAGYTDALKNFVNCYHAGSVSGVHAGGIVGYANNAGASFCYWLSTSVEAASGDGEGHFYDCSALSEAQMKAVAGATDSSWNTIEIPNNNVGGRISLVDALNACSNGIYINGMAYSSWHICSASEAPMYPILDLKACEFTDNGDGNTHKKQYECCEGVVDAEDHFGAVTVTCLGTVCEGCGAYYGDTDSANHVSTEREYRPDKTEPYDYHNQHNSCCGAVVEDTEGRHNDFTYTMEQINDSEQYVFTKNCLTCNGIVGKQYITVADRPYSNIPHAYGMDEAEGNFGYLEGTYCCDGGCINVGDHTLSFILSSQHTFEISFTITEHTKNDHVFDSNGFCTVCGALNATLVGSNLSLDGNIGLNFYFEIDEAIVNSNTSTVRFTLANGTVIDIPVRDGKIDTTAVSGKTLYVYTCELNAKQMADTVLAQVIMGENTSAQYPHSIVGYANTILANKDNTYTDDEIALVKAMLNYGANTQLNFGYNTDNLANAGLNDAEKSFSDVTEETFESHKVTATTVEGVGTFLGSDLVLESETTLNVYFKPADGINIDTLVFSVGGKTVTSVKSVDHYIISISNITSSELDTPYEISVSDGTLSGTFNCSVFSYCYSVLSSTSNTYTDELKDTLKALYLYNAAANTYFDSKE